MSLFNKDAKERFEESLEAGPIVAAEQIQATIGSEGIKGGNGLGSQTKTTADPKSFGATQKALDLQQQTSQQQQSINDVVAFVMGQTEKETKKFLESNTETTEIDRMFLGQEKLGQDTLSPIIEKLMTAKESGSGGYDSLYDQSQKETFKGIVPTEMTIGEVLAFQKKRGKGSYASFVKANNPKGTISTPVGKFQYVGKTLQGEVDEYDYDLNTKFDANTQNTIFYNHANRLIENEETPAGERSVMRSTWEGFESKEAVSDKELDALITEIKSRK